MDTYIIIQTVKIVYEVEANSKEDALSKISDNPGDERHIIKEVVTKI